MIQSDISSKLLIPGISRNYYNNQNLKTHFIYTPKKEEHFITLILKAAQNEKCVTIVCQSETFPQYTLSKHCCQG